MHQESAGGEKCKDQMFKIWPDHRIVAIQVFSTRDPVDEPHHTLFYLYLSEVVYTDEFTEKHKCILYTHTYITERPASTHPIWSTK